MSAGLHVRRPRDAARQVAVTSHLALRAMLDDPSRFAEISRAAEVPAMGRSALGPAK